MFKLNEVLDIEGTQATPQVWRDFLKKTIRQAGLRPRFPLVLLITEMQSAPYSVLEDISLVVSHNGIYHFALVHTA